MAVPADHEPGPCSAVDPGPVASSAPVDATDAELAARLRLAVTRLARRLRQQGTGTLTASQASALATADRLGAPSLGELAAAERVQPPTMTRIVGALEDAGLLERLVDDTDRRVVRVRATPAGRRVLQQSRSRKTAFLVRRLRQLDQSQRDALVQLVELLERLVAEP